MYNSYKPWPILPPALFIILPWVRTIANAPIIDPAIPTVLSTGISRNIPPAINPSEINVRAHDPASINASNGLPSLHNTYAFIPNPKNIWIAPNTTDNASIDITSVLVSKSLGNWSLNKSPKNAP